MRGLLIVGLAGVLAAPAGAAGRCAAERAARSAAAGQVRADVRAIGVAHHDAGVLARELGVARLQQHKGELYVARLGATLGRLEAGYARGCEGAALRGDCGRRRERLESLRVLRQRSVDGIPAGAARVAGLEAQASAAAARLGAARGLLVVDHQAVVDAAAALHACEAG